MTIHAGVLPVSRKTVSHPLPDVIGLAASVRTSPQTGPMVTLHLP